MENTSGQGKAAVVPEEVKGLAWGAFFWSFIWGIFNRTWIALLALVPLVGFVMPFVLLFKGREWAWRNKRWDSVEHFNKVQRRWAMVFLMILLSTFLLGIILAVVLPMIAGSSGQSAKVEAAPKPPVAKAAPPAPAMPAAPKPAVVAKEKETGPVTAATAASSSAATTAPAPATTATSALKPQLMTPKELKESQAESDRNTKGGNKVADVSKTDPKTAGATPASHGETGTAAPAKATNKNVKAKPPKLDKSPAPTPIVADVVAQEPPKKVITVKFNDLVTAVMYQDQASVMELLDLGWWVDKQDSSGFTPLMAAVSIGNTVIAELLLKRGANPNLVSSRGDSALRQAERNRDAKMISLLQSHGATVE